MVLELYFANSNYAKKNNKIQRNKNNVLIIPFKTIYNYFIWNYENIYFLTLAFFQLLTLGILPANWSPTGAFSTAIPLFICIIAEIFINLYKWYRDYKLDEKENNIFFDCIEFISEQKTINNSMTIKKKIWICIQVI